jgi:cytochrome c55X
MPRAAALLTATALVAWCCHGVAGEAATADPAPARQQQLVRMVRQDCGSCHGMRLTGGLGPALTREALADRPLVSVAATIFHGRPGTPMPPWRAMLNEREAEWIAQRLLAGFPEEAAKASP